VSISGQERTAKAAGGKARGARDLRLDFFRGLSLFFIFIDHIPENLLSYFTFRSVAFSDAAEVFIFISGFTAALVYGRSFEENGGLYATAQIYRRVWQLYVAHIFLFVIFTAEVSYTIFVVRNPMFTDEMGVGDFLETPHLAIIRTLFLGFQPNFLDILPLYIVLLMGFPLVLFLLRRSTLLTVGLSALLYGGAQLFGWAPKTFPEHHSWFFNPLAWQFMFVIGAAAGYSRVNGKWPFPSGPWLKYLSIAITVFAAVISLSWMLHWFYDPFPPFLARQLYYHTIDKTNLAPLRLINFLAIAVVTVSFIKPDSGFLHKAWARPIILCGQHSLYVFCVGIVLSVLGHFLLAELYGGVFMQVAVNLAGIGIMIAVALLLEWFKAAGRRPPRSHPGSRPRTRPRPAAIAAAPREIAQ
jgi:hypothetical protein